MILEEKPICRAAITQLVSARPEFGPPHLAASLAEAMEIIAGVKPDLLLVDLFRSAMTSRE
jgi:response regulator of citrate/malate metabolism